MSRSLSNCFSALLPTPVSLPGYSLLVSRKYQVRQGWVRSSSVCFIPLEAPETSTDSYQRAAVWSNLDFLPMFKNNLLLASFSPYSFPPLYSQAIPLHTKQTYASTYE